MLNIIGAIGGLGGGNARKPEHEGPSLNLAIGAALVGVVIAVVLFFIYRPAPGITFALVVIGGGGAVMLAVGASLTRQWLRNR